MHFNPPTPCGVGHRRQSAGSSRAGFQSTHPVWGGTTMEIYAHSIDAISIHPPRVGWDYGYLKNSLCIKISIHPPRVGWDSLSSDCGLQPLNFNPPTPCGVGPPNNVAVYFDGEFQSTHPVWGGTVLGLTSADDCTISIHPPRVGWDGAFDIVHSVHVISIHPPRVGWDVFISSISLRTYISIHPPRVGWDLRKRALADQF